MLALQTPSLKPFTDLSLEKSADDLKSLLIIGFETAIDQGLPPQKAVSVILEWAADECARLSEAASS